MRRHKFAVDKHGLVYTLKFGALMVVIFVSADYGANQIGKLFAPEETPEITSAPKITDTFYLELPDEKPVFLKKQEILKKKEALLWEKRDFIFADIEAGILSFYQNGALRATLPIMARASEGSFFETPSGFYTVQSKTKNHLSVIEGVRFPWTLHLYGNYLIHGEPANAAGRPSSSRFSSGLRLAVNDAKEIFAFSHEGMPVLIASPAVTPPAVQFAYFRKTNLPHRVPEVTSASALAADIETGEILFEKNKNNSFPTASITKLMTALLAADALSTSTALTVTRDALAVYGHTAGFAEGETFSAHDLLYGLILPSSNDAAYIFASSTPDFMARMTQEAQTLGMNGTMFEDTSGLSDKNISSAYDLLKLLSHIYSHTPQILEISRAKEYRARPLNKKPAHVWRNINWPLPDERFLGGKAGWTEDSLQTMAGIYKVRVSESGGRPIAIIVLGSRDRVRDIRAIIKYLEQDFVYGTILTKDKNEPRTTSFGANIYEAIENINR